MALKSLLRVCPALATSGGLLPQYTRAPALLLPQISAPASPFRSYSDGGSAVTDVANSQEYQKIIDGGGLVVADFTAAWCGPCRKIAPVFNQMSLDNPKAQFLKVDIDSAELQDVVVKEQISAVPTFILYMNKEKVHTLTGADIHGLMTAVQEYSD